MFLIELVKVAVEFSAALTVVLLVTGFFFAVTASLVIASLVRTRG